MKISDLVAERQLEIDEKAEKEEKRKEELRLSNFLAAGWLRSAAINLLSAETGVDPQEFFAQELLTVQFVRMGNNITVTDEAGSRGMLKFSDLGMSFVVDVNVPLVSTIVINLPGHTVIEIDMEFRRDNYRKVGYPNFKLACTYIINNNYRDPERNLADAIIKARDAFVQDEKFWAEEEAEQAAEEAAGAADNLAKKELERAEKLAAKSDLATRVEDLTIQNDQLRTDKIDLTRRLIALGRIRTDKEEEKTTPPSEGMFLNEVGQWTTEEAHAERVRQEAMERLELRRR